MWSGLHGRNMLCLKNKCWEQIAYPKVWENKQTIMIKNMWIFLNCCLEWFPKIFEYLQSAGGDEKVFVWTAVAGKGALPNVIIIIVITFITAIITTIIIHLYHHHRQGSGLWEKSGRMEKRYRSEVWKKYKTIYVSGRNKILTYHSIFSETSRYKRTL